VTSIDATPAVRAAAEAAMADPMGWLPSDDPVVARKYANAAVTAALPHLAEAFARLVEDEWRAFPSRSYITGEVATQMAARLIREAATKTDDAPPVKHHRTGPGRCACGYDAYEVGGFFPDYHAMLMNHLNRAERDAARRAIRAATNPEVS
jgi:hypothetical protein